MAAASPRSINEGTRSKTRMKKWVPCLSLLFLLLSLYGVRANAETWTGDLDKLAAHRVIRALVPYSKTFYFLDQATPRGLTYDTLKAFETHINKTLEKKHLKVHVVIIPTQRDRLIPSLISGHGDIAAGNLTITQDRKQLVAFSRPFMTDIDEILITGPSAPPVKTLADLSGKKIHVRGSSSYYSSLEKLSNDFTSKGKKPLALIKTEEFLEDEDLAEMVNADFIPMIVMDSHKAAFWAKIFNGIKCHPDIVFRTGGQIAWATRKDSPKLLEQINEFTLTGKKGTLLGNILFERYLKNTGYVKPSPRGDFKEAMPIFKKYGEKYGFNWLMLKAVAFQESGINQKKVSHRGAVGVMQIMPATAKDPNVNVPDIHILDNNIHAGTKYLRFIKDRYFSAENIKDRDRILLALAAYNAGPRQVAGLRKTAEKQGLNPDIWFKNVEVAAARRIGRETVQYVSNIMKYYITYSRMSEISAKKQDR